MNNRCFIHTIYFIVAILLFPTGIFAQRGDFRYYAQMNCIASGSEYAPYWFTANKNAISSVKSTSGYLRYGMSYSNTFGKKKNFRYDIAADIIAGFNQTSTISFQQLSPWMSPITIISCFCIPNLYPKTKLVYKCVLCHSFHSRGEHCKEFINDLWA